MPTPLDVPADALIEHVARFLRENVGEVTPPTWSTTSKTGAHRERPPHDPNWWYVRCASLLRKLYVHGPIGVSRLRVEYGGRVRKGTSIEHSRPAGGSAIREPLQQLEKAGFVGKSTKKGRTLSAEGISLLNRLAAEVNKELAAQKAPAQ